MSNKLTINTAIFVLADIVNKAIPFLLLPVLTRYLGADDYGVLTIYNSLLSFATVLIGFSVVGYINLNYYSSTAEQKRKIISSSIVIFIIISLINLLIGLFVNQLILPEITFYWSLIISLTGLLFNVNNLVLSILILEQKPLIFASLQISESLIKIIFSLLFVVSLGYNWSGRAYGILIGTASLAVVTVFILNRKYSLTVVRESKYYYSIYKYGITLLVHQISQWIKQNVDKIIILFLLGKASTGIYSVALQFGIVLGIITTAFNKSWVPYFFKIVEDPAEGKKIFRIILVYIPSILVLSSLMYVVFRFVILYVFGTEFHEAIEYIPYVLLGYSFQGMYFMVVNYMFYFKKNRIMSSVSFLTTSIHIVLMYFGIEYYGLKGGVIAFSFTYFLLFLITAIIVTYYLRQSKNGEVC